jgi:hypothetical protein
MRSAAFTALAALIALSAFGGPVRADTVRCPDGRHHQGDPLDAPCTQACPRGGWDLLGGDCSPERPRREIRPSAPRVRRAPEIVIGVVDDPLRARCAFVWPGDLVRQGACERELGAQLARVPRNAPAGLDDPLEQEIFLFCLDESYVAGEGRPDFRDAARCVSAQKDALRRLDSFLRVTDGHFE